KSSNLVSDEKLYKLRMKPWSSVGLPEIPSYESYLQNNHSITTLNGLSKPDKKHRILELIQTTKLQLDKAASSCEELCHKLETEQVLKDRTRIGDYCPVSLWYNNLRKTCEVYKAQLSRVESNMDEVYEMKRVDGCLQYFPIYSVVRRN
ncbi:hypothetical protein JCM33374_g4543, partial [Metschnikowia sp. JCM 33374]